MRKTIAALTLAGVLAVSGTACSSSSASSFCDKAKKYDKDSTLNDADFSDENGMNKAKDAMDDLAKSAPDAIKDDVDTVRDAFNKLADAGSDSEALAKLESDIDMEKVQASSDKVTAYMEKECGIKSSDSSDT